MEGYELQQAQDGTLIGGAVDERHDGIKDSRPPSRDWGIKG